eukprot:gnl/Chilomastix_cuspidata/4181.p1 GENE.gnl/Chilomastix_cuspidata/4181~~gnl/Chilomastix_cuspidata/4181.p1  ORF type:complete len:517 (+),score=179.70 gnl/Chilomastix_cuspidata/4181:462-2012(+)
MLSSQQFVNHLQSSACIGGKLRLFQNVSHYLSHKRISPFTIFPVTYTVTGGGDDEFAQFQKHHQALARGDNPRDAGLALRKALQFTPGAENPQNLWIVKPIGFNRGKGITVVETVEKARDWINRGVRGEIAGTGRPVKRWLVQKYIERPLLVRGRKFDLRMYGLVTGKGDAFFYRDGYVRMSSTPFSLECLDASIHLTNNAVQKHAEQYGEFEEGNMMSLREFDEYLMREAPHAPSVAAYFFPRMRWIAHATFASVASKFSSERTPTGFELFGFDFMIDERFNIVLIEVNSNPCLDLACAVSWRILPYLLDDVLALTVDCTLKPPSRIASRVAAAACAPRLVGPRAHDARSKATRNPPARPYDPWPLDAPPPSVAGRARDYTQYSEWLQSVPVLRWDSREGVDAAFRNRPNNFELLMKRHAPVPLENPPPVPKHHVSPKLQDTAPDTSDTPAEPAESERPAVPDPSPHNEGVEEKSVSEEAPIAEDSKSDTPPEAISAEQIEPPETKETPSSGGVS